MKTRFRLLAINFGNSISTVRCRLPVTLCHGTIAALKLAYGVRVNIMNQHHNFPAS